MGKEKEEVEI